MSPQTKKLLPLFMVAWINFDMIKVTVEPNKQVLINKIDVVMVEESGTRTKITVRNRKDPIEVKENFSEVEKALNKSDK